MDVAIDKLIDRLYEEGIKKAEKRAEELLKQTEEKAQNLLKETEKRAFEIMKQTESNLNAKKESLMAELKLAAQAALAELREKIKENILQKVIVENVRKEILEDKDFLKKAILTILAKAEGDFKLTVSQELADDLQAYFSAKTNEVLKHLEIEVIPGVKGFVIEEKKEGYALEFSDETLVAFFSQYLKPYTAALLKNP